MSAKVKRAIFILILSEFLVCLGIGLVIPVMPFLKTELHLSALDMGIMTSLFALAQFVASPIVGRISDKVGRKPILAIGLALYMVSEFVFAVTNYLWVFNISRIIGGISAAMVTPTGMALAADITTKRQRAKVIGWLSAAFSGGLILGPGVGGILAGIDYKAPFWVAGVLGLLSTIALLAMLPKDSDIDMVNTDVEQMQRDINSMKGDWRDLLIKPVILLFVLILVSSFGLQGFESIYSLYVNEVFHFSIDNIALVLTLNGLISLFFQVMLFDRLVVWLKETRLIRYCFLLAFAGTIWIIFAHSKIEVIIATLFAFTAFDLLRPAITTLLTKLSAKNQGLINGLNMSLTSVGNVIGPLMSGALLDMNTHYPYIVVAGFLGVSYLMTFAVRIKAHAIS
ncbi:tetracycline resistance MFS efflux pump [Secundilactobacillus similis DSM 23365 = JCM 2765]|uniref:Major facilitator superfamily permease n=1 Tax=Secundilactobacillus similis DSM 23365 = JCM 2765 TaxID=1423804 RepID=A0A0R2FAP6_9LACO|nr:MFS transporter [Secundilactobacillus similis]KRN25442.1 major facilitator superfamily permease [Secundilactobacillus similis DSM 23365 = JCM 2765]